MEVKRPLERNPPIKTDTFFIDLEKERISSERLLAYIDEHAPLEKDEDRAKREQLLNEINHMFIDWVRDQAVEKGLYPNKDSAMEVRAAIYLSGSYRLGYNAPDGDVDTICVCPNFITKEDFFGSFIDRLKSHPQFEDCNPLPDAGVPIIESFIAGINLDMGFARLITPTIPDNFNILDDEILNGLDSSSRTALNGPRVTELIHRLVENLDTFKVVVRALRLWAKRRGLYSNKLGFLGGVNFNILAVFICQLYPNFSPSVLLYQFFVRFAHWTWPEPVIINAPYLVNHLGFDVWNPADPRVRAHVMPILTPAYPAYNSTMVVTRRTLGVMKEEFARGMAICFSTMKDPDANTHDWSQLFEPSDFFLRYDFFIILEATGPLEEVDKWAGFVESRLRNLVEILDQPDVPLLNIQPWTKIEKRNETITVEEVIEDKESNKITFTATTAITGNRSGNSNSSNTAYSTVSINTTGTSQGLKTEPSSIVPSNSSSINDDMTGSIRLSSTESSIERGIAMDTSSITPSSKNDTVKSENGTTVIETDEGKDIETILENIHETETRPGHTNENLPTTATTTVLVPSTSSQSTSLSSSSGSSAVPTIVAAELLPKPVPGLSSVTDTTNGSDGSPNDITSLHKDLIKPTRTVTKEIGIRSFYIGLEPDKERLRTTGLNLTSCLRLFRQTRIFGARPYSKWHEGLGLRQRIIKWNELPENIFPQGREAATIQRPLAKERREKIMEPIIAASNAAMLAQRQNAVYVKGQSAPPLPIDSPLSTITSSSTATSSTRTGSSNGSISSTIDNQANRRTGSSNVGAINPEATPFIPSTFPIPTSVVSTDGTSMIPGLSIGANIDSTMNPNTLSSSSTTTAGQKRPAPMDDSSSTSTGNDAKRPAPDVRSTVASLSTPNLAIPAPFVVPSIITAANPSAVPTASNTGAKKFKVQLLKK